MNGSKGGDDWARTRELFGVAWWNTGLAPRGKSRATSENYVVASKVIASFVREKDFAFLALGEVTLADVYACLDTAKLTGAVGVRAPGFQRDRASAVALLYDAKRLEVEEAEMMIGSWLDLTFELGWKLTLRPCGRDDSIVVAVVHWPSRLHGGQAERRRAIAEDLRRELEKYEDAVLLGDFNDEPFDSSLVHGLAAFRDRTSVRNRKRAFYNPFWRLLGERQHVEDEAGDCLPTGTFFHGTGQSRWLTLDQVLVSAALIRENRWRLIEGETRIVMHNALLGEGGTMRATFDHLPVSTKIAYAPESTDG